MSIEVSSLTEYNDEIKGQSPPSSHRRGQDSKRNTATPSRKHSSSSSSAKPSVEEEEEGIVSKVLDYIGDTAMQGAAGLADIGAGALSGVGGAVSDFKDLVGMEDDAGDFEDRLSNLAGSARGFSLRQGSPQDLPQKLVRELGSGALLTAANPSIGLPIRLAANYDEELAEQENQMRLKRWSPEKIEREMSRLKALLSAGTRTIGLGSLDDLSTIAKKGLEYGKAAGSGLQGALASLTGFGDAEEEEKEGYSANK